MKHACQEVFPCNWWFGPQYIISAGWQNTPDTYIHYFSTLNFLKSIQGIVPTYGISVICPYLKWKSYTWVHVSDSDICKERFGHSIDLNNGQEILLAYQLMRSWGKNKDMLFHMCTQLYEHPFVFFLLFLILLAFCRVVPITREM